MAQPHYHARLGPVLGHFGEDAAGRRLRLDARVSGSADGTDIRYDHGPAWGKNVTTTARPFILNTMVQPHYRARPVKPPAETITRLLRRSCLRGPCLQNR